MGDFSKEKIEDISAVEEKKHLPRRVFVEVGTWAVPIPFVGNRKFSENEIYLGFDIDHSEIFDAKRKAKRGPNEGDNIHFAQADARKLPLKKNSVDELFFGNVFGDPRVSNDETYQLIVEAERVLKQEGVLIIKETNTPLNIKRLKEILNRTSFEIEKVLTSQDNEWREKLDKYQIVGFVSGRESEAYLVFLKRKNVEN